MPRRAEFGEEIAAHIVQARINEGLDRSRPLSTLEEFAQELKKSGLCRRAPSKPTLTLILSGKRFPKLHLPFGGGPVNWDLVPQSHLGRRSSKAVQKLHERTFEIPFINQRIESIERRLTQLEQRLPTQ